MQINYISIKKQKEEKAEKEKVTREKVKIIIINMKLQKKNTTNAQNFCKGLKKCVH